MGAGRGRRSEDRWLGGHVTPIRTTAARTTAVVSGTALLVALMTSPALADRYEESDPAGDMAVQSTGKWG